ncbi:MAG: tetratricopeptide repeat protein [Bacteroidales bacterium]|nr:tetratricopeptide repeat protein [Bacteroidales bacterium]
MKKLFAIIGITLFLPAFLVAQTTSQVHKIQEKLQNATGVERVNLLIELSKAFRTISFHECVKYGEASIAEAEKLGKLDLAGLASKDLGVSGYYSGNYKEAMKYFKQGLSFYQKTQNKKGISNCVNDIGLIYESWSNFDSAAIYYQKSLDIEKELKNSEGIATSMINMGNINYYRKAYRHALEDYISALKIFVDIQDLDGMGLAYNSASVIYEQLNEYDKAKDFLQKALAIYENRNDKINQSVVLDNLAEIYYEHYNDYKQALLLYQQALDLKKEIDSKSGVAMVTCNLGALYGKMGNFSKAFTLFEQSRQLFEQIGDKTGLVIVYYNEGDIHVLAHEFRKALESFKKGLALSKKIGFADYTQKFNEGFFICYAGLGEFDNFTRYYQIYKAKQDSLINKLELENTSEIENQYKVKELTQKSNELKEESRQQTKRIRNYDFVGAIFIASLVILLVSILFYIRLRKNVRHVEEE